VDRVDAWLADQAIVLVDARDLRSFKQSHIRSSHSKPPASTDQSLAELIQRASGKRLVVYCESAGCSMADDLAGRLVEIDPKLKPLVLEGGMRAWREAARKASTSTPARFPVTEGEGS
jgi:rhodanese-related sulfurtransferase